MQIEIYIVGLIGGAAALFLCAFLLWFAWLQYRTGYADGVNEGVRIAALRRKDKAS